MTQEQRAALRALAEKATPGPWRVQVSGQGAVHITSTPDADYEYRNVALLNKPGSDNAAFVVAACNAVPALLDALAAAEARAVVPAGYGDCDREEIALVLERVAKEGLPGPRDLDVAIDAILCIIAGDGA